MSATIIRGVTMRRVRVSITGALLAAMTLAACAPGPPVIELEAVDAPAAQVQANSTTVEVLITELYAHFLAETEEISPQYISAEATPGVRSEERRVGKECGCRRSR